MVRFFCLSLSFTEGGFILSDGFLNCIVTLCLCFLKGIIFFSFCR